MDTEKHHISRRDFLKNSLFLITVANPLSHAILSSVKNNSNQNKFSTFILSDVHFGWDSPKQPNAEVIKRNLNKVFEHFPDLDLLIDTGDAYHNNSSEISLAEWIKIISETCGAVPLMYVPGNHEISNNNNSDSESLACKMGSIPARPYYSLTIKGIHLVSLPQMMGANYVSDEALEWVKLDLDVHNSYTTLIFSHNSLKGTTCPHDDTGYRTVANSDKVISLLRQHPQVVAWCHGHNHTWEIMQRWQKAFVSNGRFGGFPPKEMFGGERHGGIYIEIDDKHISIRGWSCDDENFLDEIKSDYVNLQYKLEIPTSFNPDESPAVSYGAGLSRDGQRIPVYRHYTGTNPRAKVYFMGVGDKAFNENNAFSAYGERPSGSKMLPAMEVTGIRTKDKEQWKWSNPGILLTPISGSAGIISPRRGDAKHCYYPTAPGKKYKGYLRVYTFSPGSVVAFIWRVYRSDGTLIIESKSEETILNEGYNEVESKFQVPEIKIESIYNNDDSNFQILLSAECSFRNTGEGVRVELWQIQVDTSELYTKNPGVEIRGNVYSHEGILKDCEKASLDITLPNTSRFVITTKAQGIGLTTYLIEEKGIEFQIRNAPGWQSTTEFHLGEARANFGNHTPSTIIAPLMKSKMDFYIFKTSSAKTIEEIKKTIDEYVFKVRGNQQTEIYLEIFSPKQPTNIDGAIKWSYEAKLLKLVCDSDATIKISWQ